MLIYYSITIPTTELGKRLCFQLVTSILSLRAQNPDIPIHCCIYDQAPPEITQFLAQQRVQVHPCGPYRETLKKYNAVGADTLVHYPLLHKVLSLPIVAQAQPTDQILLVDCDTYFFGDPAKLFQKYNQQDLYARETLYFNRKRAQALGDSLRIERLQTYQRMAEATGLNAVPDFNLGTVLFNHQLWQRLSLQQFIDYAWRLAIWMAQYPEPNEKQTSILYLKDQLQNLSKTEHQSALAYPCPGARWILDQVALWYALGEIEDYSYGDFEADEVGLGDEIHHQWKPQTWTLVHYGSYQTKRFAHLLSAYLGLDRPLVQ